MKTAFLAGQGDRVMDFLLQYCRKRLLCDRVPYAAEANPEVGKRHLSAESALLFRKLTEGILGIRPESLNSFSCVPRLLKGMPHLHLSRLYIAGRDWSIRVEQKCWSVFCDGDLYANGSTGGEKVTIGWMLTQRVFACHGTT